MDIGHSNCKVGHSNCKMSFPTINLMLDDVMCSMHMLDVNLYNYFVPAVQAAILSGDQSAEVQGSPAVGCDPTISWY